MLFYQLLPENRCRKGNILLLGTNIVSSMGVTICIHSVSKVGFTILLAGWDLPYCEQGGRYNEI